MTISPKIKNALIFGGIAVALILIYVFFIKSDAPEASLVSTDGTTATGAQAAPTITQDFLTLLLNIKSIKLDDSIFSDPAFLSLQDSTIVINEDVGGQGRPNPFAPIGSDPAPVQTPPATTTTTTTTNPASPSTPGNPTGAPAANPTQPATTPPATTPPASTTTTTTTPTTTTTTTTTTPATTTPPPGAAAH